MGILASSGGKVEFPLNGKSAPLYKEELVICRKEVYIMT